MARLDAVSPIEGRRYQGQALWLSPSVEYGFVQIKGRHLPGDALAEIAEIGEDAKPGRLSGQILWIGPEERLLLDHSESGELLPRAQKSLPDGCFARSATSGLVAIAMKGASVRRLVENETSAVDFTPGFASRVRFADLAVTIIVRAEDDLLCLVARSAAAWLFDWLENRAKLLGL